MQEHPFAPYVRILARGKSNTRPLTIDEADAAMTMILEGQVKQEQIGGFLMVLRYKEETRQEVAGFVRAAQRFVALPENTPVVDLDWSCYAGKKRQLPWFALAAVALAQSGTKIFMHGVEGHTAGRIYAEQTMRSLGLPVADSLEDAAQTLLTSNLCYLPLREINSTLSDLIDLKAVLGLRSPVHTVARMINPFRAKHVLQGIFHPGFNEVHQQAAALIGQPHLAVFRGEGGEVERRPQKPVDVHTVDNGAIATETWPALLSDPFQETDHEMDMNRLRLQWQGDIKDPYGEAAIIGTLAIALKMLGKAATQDDALSLAAQVWDERNPSIDV